MQYLHSTRTSWHITFGTYCTRLHGDARPTVDKQHNQLGTPFLSADATRKRLARQRMVSTPRYLTKPQRLFIEQQLSSICERGGWNYRVAAAGADHVHLLCDVVPAVHGEKVRRLVKRWLGQALSEKWPLDDGIRWRAIEGSNKAVRDQSYLNIAFWYIQRQRTTPSKSAHPKRTGSSPSPAPGTPISPTIGYDKGLRNRTSR